jgi:hypothetical protein
MVWGSAVNFGKSLVMNASSICVPSSGTAITYATPFIGVLQLLETLHHFYSSLLSLGFSLGNFTDISSSSEILSILVISIFHSVTGF